MKITLLTIGKLKENYLRDAVAEYLKRLGRYASLSVIECADEPIKEGASDGQTGIALAKEGRRILDRIPHDSYVTALAIGGRQYDSPGLADWMQKRMNEGCSHLTFIIGGSAGLDPAVLQRCDEQLSFSRLTFPHQLMRVILLEQLYRCFKIINHEPYHK